MDRAGPAERVQDEVSRVLAVRAVLGLLQVWQLYVVAVLVGLGNLFEKARIRFSGVAVVSTEPHQRHLRAEILEGLRAGFHRL
jgi:hypothetical protein